MSSDQVVAGDAAREPADGTTLDEPAVRRALESVAELERTLGPDHPDTLNARNGLAAAYQAAGRHAEGILLFQLTLAAREGMLGTDHPDARTARDSLAAARQETQARRQDVSQLSPRVEEPPAEEPSELAPPAEEARQEPLTEQSPAAPSTRRPWPAPDRPARRRRRVVSLVAAIVIVCAAGGVAGLVTRTHAGHHGSAASHRAGSQPLSTAGQLAAVWVAQQVGRNAIVACARGSGSARR